MFASFLFFFIEIIPNVFLCLYFQMQYKAKKPQRQLNIKVEETKPALYNKDNIDDLYL